MRMVYHKLGREGMVHWALDRGMLRIFGRDQVSKIRGEVDLPVFSGNWFIWDILRDRLLNESS